jgi:hypothetical protein
MTKIINATTGLPFVFEEPYEPMPVLETYAVAPTPLPTKRERKAAQASAMAFVCKDADVWTGYANVPIERLREDVSIHMLLDMLETCRPGQSKEEEAFISTYLGPLEPFVDAYGNSHIKVQPPEGVKGYPNILWSCHTDTVHRHGGTQKVEVSNGMAWTSDGSCLGSDDTVGIWLALEMIKAGVPGTYVFHRDEESGGGGSMWLAKEGAAYLGQFDAAIALDRAGYRDVITYQGGERCCSEAFAKSLAMVIGGEFKPCDSGVFTDTANYTDLIGECTNLSVGYFRQHGPMEHTNLSFAASLRDALIKADWTQLALVRKPGEVEETRWSRYSMYDDKWGFNEPMAKRDRAYGDEGSELDAMEAYVKEFPWVVAEYLLEMGVTMEDLDVYEPGDLS